MLRIVCYVQGVPSWIQIQILAVNVRLLILLSVLSLKKHLTSDESRDKLKERKVGVVCQKKSAVPLTSQKIKLEMSRSTGYNLKVFKCSQLI